MVNKLLLMIWIGEGAVRWEQVQITFSVHCNWKLHIIQFHSFHVFTQMPTFLFQSTLSQHEAEKVGMLVLFCLGFLFWLFYDIFSLVCLFHFDFSTLSAFITAYCMHIMYHITQILLQPCTRLLPSV